MPDSSQILSFLQNQMQTQPGLFAATVGMIVSSSYVLLMVVTRLGDIKPGAQSFVLSALIHAMMALFWGTLVVPGGKIAQPATPELVQIRQVLVEDKEAPDLPGASTRPVWDRLPSAQKEDFNRIDALPSETVPLETPEHMPEIVEPLKGRLPDLPQTEAVEVASPQPAQVAEPSCKCGF